MQQRAIIFQLCQENFTIMTIVILTQDADELETGQTQEDGPKTIKSVMGNILLHSKQATLRAHKFCFHVSPSLPIKKKSNHETKKTQ